MTWNFFVTPNRWSSLYPRGLLQPVFIVQEPSLPEIMLIDDYVGLKYIVIN
jgi:hypothetical protein